ncbi:hypothetical protein [Algoriphagus sp. oki45]|uniref:hypothetical protein n=1 Tax=Algoriphagus sp. oki45 TaxID=3067294 RepID=UPI0030C66785
MSRFLILFLFSSFSSVFSFAQEKSEREVRVKASEVPSSAKDWLKDAFEEIKRPKWYLEFSLEGKAFEAKFWREKHFHSVKFDSLGRLVDVEIEITKKEMPEESWLAIESYLESEFEEFAVQKIQRQLIGEEGDVEDYFDENETEGVKIRYEIVFEGKKENWQLWEALFDESGAFLTLVRIQVKPVDNLIF